jgi:hypothetical protein
MLFEEYFALKKNLPYIHFIELQKIQTFHKFCDSRWVLTMVFIYLELMYVSKVQFIILSSFPLSHIISPLGKLLIMLAAEIISAPLQEQLS